MYKTGIKQKARSHKQNSDRIALLKRNRGKYSAIQRCPIPVKFYCKSSFDEAEFSRQLNAQQAGMNQLTYREYLANRRSYLARGRAPEGSAAQHAAREAARLEKVTELRNGGATLEEAEVQAGQWLKTQAALHNPDQIAGGNPTHIGGLGDKRINSSLGSQWKSRIAGVDSQIRERTDNMTEAERARKHLNVRFTYEIE